MPPANRNAAWSFAEVLVVAPWATTLLSGTHDKNEGGMLQRNRFADEWPRAEELDHEARDLRARHVAAIGRRLGQRLRAKLRRTVLSLGSRVSEG